jgi:hypothetical protein
MIGRLVLRHLALHPIRSLVFVGAYAAGVSVMLALLSIGEVMVDQSRDEQWVGGGDVTVVPAGIDLETLRTGGAAFFGIEQARFLAREVLGGPRLANSVEAVAPWIDARAVYLRPSAGSVAVAVRASGQVPSAAEALQAHPEITSGRWTDSDYGARWLQPTRVQLYHELDRFHLPPEQVRGDSTWAEWHYFNLLWPGQERWLYLSYILGGDLESDRWGGIVLARYRTPDGHHRSYADTVTADDIVFSTSSADLKLGSHTVELIDNPVRYQVRARLQALQGGPPLTIDVEVHPRPHRYFPPVQLAASGSFVSGYVVPALRADATGRVCLGADCLDVRETTGYHDHNWGTWGGVVWDWGVAHAADFDVLYGGVHGEAAEDARNAGARFLGYVVDSLGVAAVLEPRELVYTGRQAIRFENETVPVPEGLSWIAVQGTDSLTVQIAFERVALSRLALGGDQDVHFAQMQGTLTMRGVLGGRAVDARGPGFFETYLR